MRINTSKGANPASPKKSTESPKKSEIVTASNSSQAPAKKAVFALPLEKTSSSVSLDKLSMLVYGEKKIGKTEFAAQFPKTLFLAFEKGYVGLEVFVLDMFDSKGLPDWRLFVQAIDLLVKQPHEFETIVIDTVDIAYNACMEYVGMMEGFSHPTDLPYGKGWKAVQQEFTKQINRLVNVPSLGVIFISHASEKAMTERTGGKYDKIIPSLPNQAKDAISAICDIICFYGYFGESRLLTIRGGDNVESGSRMRDNFWVVGGKKRYSELVEKKRELEKLGTKEARKEIEEISKQLERQRVHSIDAGTDASETYKNFVDAFENRQRTCGSPKYSFANIEKKAPMKG